jgi:hypothetical protein
LTDIEETITNKSIGGLTLRVDNAKLANIAVAVSYTLRAGNLASTVSLAVKAAVESYISANNWEWGQTIYRNEVIALVDRVAGVERVVSVNITDVDGEGSVNGTTGDFAFTYVGVLPVATATVTVA